MTSSKVKALISKQSQDKDDEFKKSKTLLADKLGLGKLNASQVEEEEDLSSENFEKELDEVIHHI